MSWSLVYSKYAIKDAKKLSAVGLKDRAQDLLGILEANPFQNPPPYEKLIGDLIPPHHYKSSIPGQWRSRLITPVAAPVLLVAQLMGRLIPRVMRGLITM